MDLNVKNKVVIITGAGGGIGRATALHFASSGAHVVATDLDNKAAQATIDAIEAAGGEALAITHDVSSEAAWLDVLGRAQERFGGVDVLVNNAGIFIIAPIEATTVDQWDKIMAINVTGTFLGAKHVVPYLRKRGGGSIINMSSVSGVRGSANDAAYGASKGAVTLFTMHLAAELGADNIRVNAVAPTLVRTAMADYASRENGSSPEELGRQLPCSAGWRNRTTWPPWLSSWRPRKPAISPRRPTWWMAARLGLRCRGDEPVFAGCAWQRASRRRQSRRRVRLWPRQSARWRLRSRHSRAC